MPDGSRAACRTAWMTISLIPNFIKDEIGVRRYHQPTNIGIVRAPADMRMGRQKIDQPLQPSLDTAGTLR
ncbi:MAG TPA: hypothetical protein VMI30_00800 [Stellaceae bacterium]|nr:hypothetical protein [Stellaceae bacterium]